MRCSHRGNSSQQSGVGDTLAGLLYTATGAVITSSSRRRSCCRAGVRRRQQQGASTVLRSPPPPRRPVLVRRLGMRGEGLELWNCGSGSVELWDL